MKDESRKPSSNTQILDYHYSFIREKLVLSLSKYSWTVSPNHGNPIIKKIKVKTMPPTPYQTALDRIRQAADSRAETLDLSNLGLTSLPSPHPFPSAYLLTIR